MTLQFPYLPSRIALCLKQAIFPYICPLKYNIIKFLKENKNADTSVSAFNIKPPDTEFSDVQAQLFQI